MLMRFFFVALQIIDTLYHNEEIRNNLEMFKLDMDENTVLFLSCFKKIRECAEERFKTSAKEMRERHVSLRKAWKGNVDMTEEIRSKKAPYKCPKHFFSNFFSEELETVLSKQKKEICEQLKLKEKMCEDYEKKIENLQQSFKNHIRKIVYVFSTTEHTFRRYTLARFAFEIFRISIAILFKCQGA